MKINFLSILLISTLLFFSCSNDDDSSRNEEILQNSCELNQGNSKYTECCLEGPLKVKPGNTFYASFTSTYINPEFSWEVLGGSLEIIEGGNSARAKFKAKPDFVHDTLLGISQLNTPNGIMICSDLIVITSE
ncbi:hypothetical protein O4H26_03790 [Aequorivita viscosa]|nr:hypothetical protein [Aequorivita viscosa]